jgi:hypothetical protein
MCNAPQLIRSKREDGPSPAYPRHLHGRVIYKDLGDPRTAGDVLKFELRRMSNHTSFASVRQ